MTKRSLPLAKVYGLLEPGPVVLLSTTHKGKADVMTLSWHTMMEFEPPLVGCVVSGRDFSFAGQKIMLRIGPDNARVVKGKLREFRQVLVKLEK